MDGEFASWKVMDWLQAGVHVVGLVGGLAGGCIFVAKKFKRFSRYKYPSQGEIGPNILAPDVERVNAGEHVSMSAIVPEGAELLVSITSDPEFTSSNGSISIPIASSMGGAWFYSLAPAPLNWRSSHYRHATAEIGAQQNFKARSGPAELDIHFKKVGPISIAVYERGAQIPTWTKSIQVMSSESL